MADLSFKITGVEAVARGIIPLLQFKLQVANAPATEAIQAVILNAQIQIQSAQRAYTPQEKDRLVEMFGTPDRWGQTLRNRLWAHVNVTLPPFIGNTEALLPVQCTYDLNVIGGKYFYALEGDDVPLLFLFSGTVFYQTADERLQIQRISWEKECTYRMTVRVWRDLMEQHFPNSAWLNLQRDVFNRLYDYKRQHGLATWEQTIEHLLPGRGECMNRALVDQIANAVLYEGYILYPYRPSSKKNQRGRFTFGRVYPQAYSEAQHGTEPYMMQTECLARIVGREPKLNVTVRFLQPLSPARDTGWQEAAEREVKLQAPLPADARHSFKHDSLAGLVELSTNLVSSGLLKITVRVCNLTPITEMKDTEAILPRTFTSTHAILHIEGGEFISALETESSDTCKNIGAWPVLVGDEAKGERDTILSSPIILSDYPQIAPQSTGDFFDGTEIDEMLTLRVQTMTEEEKREMRNVDAHARRLLERVETFSEEQMMEMHGLMRKCGEAPVQTGDRVRIRPKSRADAMDMILDGKTAVVEAVEQDAEGKFHLALVLDDDPGKDLGMLRQPGHRFFYGIEEVEPV